MNLKKGDQGKGQDVTVKVGDETFTSKAEDENTPASGGAAAAGPAPASGASS